jgi:hypothetical protein
MVETIARLEALFGRLESFEKRLPNVIRQALISAGVHTKQVRIPVPDTRRIADGGVHGSEQRKKSATTLLTVTPPSAMLDLHPAKQAGGQNGRRRNVEGLSEVPLHPVSRPRSERREGDKVRVQSAPPR